MLFTEGSQTRVRPQAQSERRGDAELALCSKMCQRLHFLCLIAMFQTAHGRKEESRGDDYPSPKHQGQSVEKTIDQMGAISEDLERKDYGKIIRGIKALEKGLERTTFKGDHVSLSRGKLLAHIYKISGNFSGLNISASEVSSETRGSRVRVHLPKTLLSPRENRNIVFCMITVPSVFKNYSVLYGKTVGLSISDRKVSGLTEPISITFSLEDPSPLQDGKLPECHYLNDSTQSFHSDGCRTAWRKREKQVVCSCDHLTYFAVLLVDPKISERDQNVLTYISLIGCAISLLFLIAILFVYICRRKMLADASLKIHLNLVVALILLNVHFLPSQLVASLPTAGPCVYLAAMLHYSLLATFTWTAIEAFHLYLLLVRVFNIYIKRYLLKLALVGWGLPAVVVAIILIIDRNIYQRVTLQPSDNSTVSAQICYLQNSRVKLFNIVFCALVWVSSMVMLALTCKLILALRRNHVPGGKSRTLKDACAILGLSCLLGITWGLVFFSFVQLPTAAIYLFCILNSLQGFFVSLWLYLSKQRAGPVSSKCSHSTKSTDMQNKYSHSTKSTDMQNKYSHSTKSTDMQNKYSHSTKSTDMQNK